MKLGDRFCSWYFPLQSVTRKVYTIRFTRHKIDVAYGQSLRLSVALISGPDRAEG